MTPQQGSLLQTTQERIGHAAPREPRYIMNSRCECRVFPAQRPEIEISCNAGLDHLKIG
jgi:hypothetical protein